MRKSRKPPKPEKMNGDHEALWNFSYRIDGRIDQLFLAFIAQTLALLGISIGIVALILRGG